MPATPLTSPDVPVHPWDIRLAAVAEFVESHVGRFPNLYAVDPAEAELGRWWREQANLLREHPLGGRLDGVRDLAKQMRERAEQIRERADQMRITAITAYVREHEGRFPPNRSADPEVAALGCWWVAQNIELNRRKMDAARIAQLDQLRAFAADRRAAAKARHTRQVSAAGQRRVRAATRAAGVAGAAASRKALKSPHLIPGDEEVLRLRISHPHNTLTELAELAGLTPGRFATKYYGALHRGPNSRRPLHKELPERMLAPGEAGDLLGVPRTILARWANAGRLPVELNRQGHRRYLGADLLRIKDLIAEGWPQEFRMFDHDEAADLLGVPRNILTRWAKAGRLPVERSRQGHRRYLGADLLRIRDLIAAGRLQEFIDEAGGER